MPITVSYNDTVYNPQYPAELTVKITVPYKEEVCIRLNSTGTSKPSSVSVGYTYYDVLDRKVYVSLGNNNWSEGVDAHTRAEGYIYYNNSNSTFYEYNGYSLIGINLAPAYSFVYIKLVPYMNTGATMGDWCYSQSNLWYFNGLSWITHGTPFTAVKSVYYAFEQRLWYWYSADGLMHKRYGYGQITTLYHTSDFPTVFVPIEDNIEVSTTYTIPYTQTYKERGESYELQVAWKSEEGSSPEYVPDLNTSWESVITQHIQGRAGSLNLSLIQEPDTIYPFILDSDEVAFSCIVTPNSSNTGSVLVPYTPNQSGKEAAFGISWNIQKSGGGSSWYTSLENAISQGHISKVTNGKYSNTSEYNESHISLFLKEAGTYAIYATGNYRDAYGSITTFTKSVICVVYASSKPALKLMSVTPSEYMQTGTQEENENPNNGKAPFTVSWKDVSLIDSEGGNQYQIPQDSIILDFGDYESKTENKVYLKNTGNTPISLPYPQTHIYDGYGPYVASLTITDKRGNKASASLEFAPNRDPRAISAPVVTYDSSEAPVLVTGQIDVAGIPLPEITWTYALRNGDPEYYAGEKKGEYTEFSLLAGGTYDITCKAMNGEVTLGTWSWVKAITEPEPTPDTPVSANNFDIWVYQNGQRVDVIKPTRCQYVDRLAHSSYCEFDVPMDYRNVSLLMPGAEIAVGYLGKARYMMVTEFSEDSLGEYCSVTAMDAATVALQNRIATVATHSLSDGGYDVQTCSAERLLRYFAVSNIRSGNRVVPRFRVVGTNQDRGGKITYSARYEPILTIMEEICTQSGLGWDSSLQSDSSVIFSFKVVGGVDHTAGTTNPVIFTERENGLRSAQVSAYHGMLGSNLVIAAGKGEGDTRVQYQDYGATTVSDIQRREVFLDASDSATDYEVQCAAETELARQDEQTITIYPNEQVYKFGVDYNLGDYVTVITKSGMQLNLQIHQANMSLDDTGVNLSLECGTDIRDYQRLIQRNKFENTYARK